MHSRLRLVLLLIIVIALRGFAGTAYALPAAAPAMADCHPATGAPHDQHGGDAKACQISCDLAAAPALPVSVAPRGGLPASPLTPTLAVLSLNDLPPPDHPPPIH